ASSGGANAVSRPTFDRYLPISERATRISCPECAGVLGVRIDGDHGHLMFVCRVGHTFSIRDLLVGKEEQIETRLWSAVVALEELVEILEDFQQRARRQGLPDAARALQERAGRTEVQVARLRSVIAESRAVEVHDEVSRIRATAERG